MNSHDSAMANFSDMVVETVARWMYSTNSAR